MSVVVDWLVRDRVIIWESSGKVTGEEIIYGNECLTALLAEVRERGLPDVHIFVDGYRAYQSPMSIHAMKHWFSYLQSGGFDWHVICASDRKIKEFCTEFAHYFKIEHVIVVDDIIEGLSFLDCKMGEDESTLLGAYRRWVRIIHERV
jgi:hypothetical protein